MRWLRTILILTAVVAAMEAHRSFAADFVVYSVFKPIDLGDSTEPPQKDFYVNMGSTQGLHSGSQLDVLRRVPTYDLLSEKLYQDVTFKIAKLKVIHVENNAAICRLDKVLASDKTPSTHVRAVMVGDLVRPAE